MVAGRRLVAGLLVPALVVAGGGALAGCTTPDAGGRPLQGRSVEVMAVWSGVEGQRFSDVLAGFEARTGASVTFTSVGRDIAGALDARLAAGSRPDVALLPQPALLARYARAGVLSPLDGPAGDLVRRNYGPVWQALGTVDGRLYGVWFKAADKSLVWYDIGRFERAGVVPPADLAGLARVARTLAGPGGAAFSVGAADGWTLTDWFENLYLAQWGPQRYDQLAAHQLAWTDRTVRDTLGWFTRLLAPDLVAGGPQGARSTSFEASVASAFGPAHAAAMVSEGDFVAALVGEAGATIGVDVDAFPFPSGGSGGPVLTGGGDAAVLVRDTPAARALVRYLATPEAAAIWARQGGFLSPNLGLDLTVYPDPLTRSMARSLLEAGDSFRFDLSDLQPVAFGSTAGQGMIGLLQDLLVSGDVDGTAVRLEEAATAAYGR
jgi:ABC-type glycerol-3-phosphate transport system substrate-binding protein